MNRPIRIVIPTAKVITSGLKEELHPGKISDCLTVACVFGVIQRTVEFW